ncbi:Uma2 family endonuclease [Nostoc sp.]|uniref:Uma2 family endonuclease n=1 Tax=Nostoc sp. TaxID=1180 RepID=UPI002FFAD7C4
MIATPNKYHLTPDEYLQWEAKQEIKHEYINGEVYARTGGTIAHNAIAVNLIAALRPHVRGSSCRVLGTEAKVGITEKGSFFYPDVLVTCNAQDRQAIQVIQFPKLIVEVLSPGTEAYNRGAKFAQYRRLETLQEYVLINSESIGVEIFRLNERSKWELTSYTNGDEIELICIEFKFPIELLYEDVEFPPQGAQNDGT